MKIPRARHHVQTLGPKKQYWYHQTAFHVTKFCFAYQDKNLEHTKSGDSRERFRSLCSRFALNEVGDFDTAAMKREDRLVSQIDQAYGHVLNKFGEAGILELIEDPDEYMRYWSGAISTQRGLFRRDAIPALKKLCNSSNELLSGRSRIVLKMFVDDRLARDPP